MDDKLKREFVELVVSGRNKNRANQIFECFPQKLYRYRSGKYKNENSVIYDVIDLFESKMRHSCVNNFNDPYDSALLCDLRRELGIEDDIISENLKEKLNQGQQELNNIIHDFRERIYIACLSENNQSILMWSHYANSHKGFCIEYDYMELCTNGISPFPVIYDDYYDFSKREDHEAIKKSLFKAKEWEYEQEWRSILIDEKNDSEIARCNAPLPKAIFMGCRIEKELKKELMNFCKDNKGVNLFQKKMKLNSFQLEDERIVL